eukprot:m.10281 g.10281  ORF g.10281 m.10281 type:complete len:381 (+) comp22125_c0_seq2:3-1145(+)
MVPHHTTRMESEVSKTLDLSVIRYSHVWEDHRSLLKGLDVGPDDDVLSITSSGDNVLNLLLEGQPRSITAIDMSPSQNAILELKLAAIKSLSHAQFVYLLGIDGEDQTGSRVHIYAQIRHELPAYARNYFDAHPEAIENGVAASGRLDKFFRSYRENHLYATAPPSSIERLFHAKTISDQAAVFNEIFTPEARDCFLSYFTFERVAKEGRDASQMKYLGETNVPETVWSRFKRTLTTVPTSDNFYLSLFLLGRESTPGEGVACPYVRAENFDRLKALADRVVVVTDTIENFILSGRSRITKMNLSDIFEYMSEDACDDMMTALADHLLPGGRLAFWTVFVPRSPSASLQKKLQLQEKLSDKIYSLDRAIFYGSFQVYERF